MIYDISLLFLSGSFLLLAHLFRQNKSANDAQSQEINDFTRKNVSQLQKIDNLTRINASQLQEIDDLTRKNVSHLQKIGCLSRTNVSLHKEIGGLTLTNVSLHKEICDMARTTFFLTNIKKWYDDREDKNISNIKELEEFKMSKLISQHVDYIKNIILGWIQSGIKNKNFSFKSNTSNIEIRHGNVFMRYYNKFNIPSPKNELIEDPIDVLNIEISIDEVNQLIFWKLTSNSCKFKKIDFSKEYDGFLSKSFLLHSDELTKKCPYLGCYHDGIRHAKTVDPMILPFSPKPSGDIIMNTLFIISEEDSWCDCIKMKEFRIISIT